MDDVQQATHFISGIVFLGTLVLVLTTSIWAGFDSKANRITTDLSKPYSFRNGAFVWFSFCLLFWIITFPFYLYRRSKILAERRRASTPPPVYPSVPATLPAVDVEQEIRMLAKLKQDGLISDTDYDQKKKQLLGIEREPTASVNCPDCKKEMSSTMKWCPHCGYILASVHTTGQDNAKVAQAEQKVQKGCLGCLGVILLLAALGWLVDEMGWNMTTPTTISAPADPNVRHIGINGAVFGTDQYGMESRLAPGTSLRYAGGSYMSDPGGPQKIYTVMDGPFAGGQVPLSESDLAPQ